MNPTQRIILTMGLSFSAGMALAFLLDANALPLAPINRSNNAIAVNACIEHGGVPLFATYARDGEEAMLVDCRIIR